MASAKPIHPTKLVFLNPRELNIDGYILFFSCYSILFSHQMLYLIINKVQLIVCDFSLVPNVELESYL